MNGESYLGVFAQEKTPLEKQFSGEKLFLSKMVFPDPVRVRLAGLLWGESGPVKSGLTLSWAFFPLLFTGATGGDASFYFGVAIFLIVILIAGWNVALFVEGPHPFAYVAALLFMAVSGGLVFSFANPSVIPFSSAELFNGLLPLLGGSFVLALLMKGNAFLRILLGSINGIFGAYLVVDGYGDLSYFFFDIGTWVFFIASFLVSSSLHNFGHALGRLTGQVFVVLHFDQKEWQSERSKKIVNFFDSLSGPLMNLLSGYFFTFLFLEMGSSLDPFITVILVSLAFWNFAIAFGAMLPFDLRHGYGKLLRGLLNKTKIITLASFRKRITNASLISFLLSLWPLLFLGAVGGISPWLHWTHAVFMVSILIAGYWGVNSFFVVERKDVFKRIAFLFAAPLIVDVATHLSRFVLYPSLVQIYLVGIGLSFIAVWVSKKNSIVRFLSSWSIGFFGAYLAGQAFHRFSFWQYDLDVLFWFFVAFALSQFIFSRGQELGRFVARNSKFKDKKITFGHAGGGLLNLVSGLIFMFGIETVSPQVSFGSSYLTSLAFWTMAVGLHSLIDKFAFDWRPLPKRYVIPETYTDGIHKAEYHKDMETKRSIPYVDYKITIIDPENSFSIDEVFSPFFAEIIAAGRKLNLDPDDVLFQLMIKIDVPNRTVNLSQFNKDFQNREELQFSAYKSLADSLEPFFDGYDLMSGGISVANLIGRYNYFNAEIDPANHGLLSHLFPDSIPTLKDVLVGTYLKPSDSFGFVNYNGKEINVISFAVSLKAHVRTKEEQAQPRRPTIQALANSDDGVDNPDVLQKSDGNSSSESFNTSGLWASLFNVSNKVAVENLGWLLEGMLTLSIFGGLYAFGVLWWIAVGASLGVYSFAHVLSRVVRTRWGEIRTEGIIGSLNDAQVSPLKAVWIGVRHLLNGVLFYGPFFYFSSQSFEINFIVWRILTFLWAFVGPSMSNSMMWSFHYSKGHYFEDSFPLGPYAETLILHSDRHLEKEAELIAHFNSEEGKVLLEKTRRFISGNNLVSKRHIIFLHRLRQLDELDEEWKTLFDFYLKRLIDRKLSIENNFEAINGLLSIIVFQIEGFKPAPLDDIREPLLSLAREYGGELEAAFSQFFDQVFPYVKAVHMQRLEYDASHAETRALVNFVDDPELSGKRESFLRIKKDINAALPLGYQFKFSTYYHPLKAGPIDKLSFGIGYGDILKQFISFRLIWSGYVWIVLLVNLVFQIEMPDAAFAMAGSLPWLIQDQNSFPIRYQLTGEPEPVARDPGGRDTSPLVGRLHAGQPRRLIDIYEALLREVEDLMELVRESAAPSINKNTLIAALVKLKHQLPKSFPRASMLAPYQNAVQLKSILFKILPELANFLRQNQKRFPELTLLLNEYFGPVPKSWKDSYSVTHVQVVESSLRTKEDVYSLMAEIRAFQSEGKVISFAFDKVLLKLESLALHLAVPTNRILRQNADLSNELSSIDVETIHSSLARFLKTHSKFLRSSENLKPLGHIDFMLRRLDRSKNEPLYIMANIRNVILFFLDWAFAWFLAGWTMNTDFISKKAKEVKPVMILFWVLIVLMAAAFAVYYFYQFAFSFAAASQDVQLYQAGFPWWMSLLMMITAMAPVFGLTIISDDFNDYKEFMFDLANHEKADVKVWRADEAFFTFYRGPQRILDTKLLSGKFLKVTLGKKKGHVHARASRSEDRYSIDYVREPDDGSDIFYRRDRYVGNGKFEIRPLNEFSYLPKKYIKQASSEDPVDERSFRFFINLIANAKDPLEKIEGLDRFSFRLRSDKRLFYQPHRQGVGKISLSLGDAKPSWIEGKVEFKESEGYVLELKRIYDDVNKETHATIFMQKMIEHAEKKKINPDAGRKIRRGHGVSRAVNLPQKDSDPQSLMEYVVASFLSEEGYNRVHDQIEARLGDGAIFPTTQDVDAWSSFLKSFPWDEMIFSNLSNFVFSRILEGNSVGLLWRTQVERFAYHWIRQVKPIADEYTPKEIIDLLTDMIYYIHLSGLLFILRTDVRVSEDIPGATRIVDSFKSRILQWARKNERNLLLEAYPTMKASIDFVTDLTVGTAVGPSYSFLPEDWPNPSMTQKKRIFERQASLISNLNVVSDDKRFARLQAQTQVVLIFLLISLTSYVTFSLDTFDNGLVFSSLPFLPLAPLRSENENDSLLEALDLILLEGSLDVAGRLRKHPVNSDTPEVNEATHALRRVEEKLRQNPNLDLRNVLAQEGVLETENDDFVLMDSSQLDQMDVVVAGLNKWAHQNGEIVIAGLTRDVAEAFEGRTLHPSITVLDVSGAEAFVDGAVDMNVLDAYPAVRGYFRMRGKTSPVNLLKSAGVTSVRINRRALGAHSPFRHERTKLFDLEMILNLLRAVKVLGPSQKIETHRKAAIAA